MILWFIKVQESEILCPQGNELANGLLLYSAYPVSSTTQSTLLQTAFTHLYSTYMQHFL